MFYYKDQSNKVHALESREFENLLPPGCESITEAEADALRNPQTPEAKLDQKKDLLAQATEIRERVLDRLNGHWVDAFSAGDTAAMSAIATCRLSLKNALNDQRVLDAENGAAKTAILQVCGEIVAALYASAPAVVVAFRGLDKF